MSAKASGGEQNRPGQNNAVSPEISDLLKRALALSVDERAALANTLLDSLEGADESMQDWDKEVARRIEDLKAGKAVTVPWEELHRELISQGDVAQSTTSNTTAQASGASQRVCVMPQKKKCVVPPPPLTAFD
jgi:putative addiction module component (TIGR02574 family)